MANNPRATQEFIPIREVRENALILKDGTLRALVMVSSINFALKNTDEQQAIIYQFQTFLNSLDFPLQIYIQSRRLDIKPYLNLLKEREEEQTNELMRLQTREYLQFIRQFTDSVNIMSKSFFIVVPYQSAIIDVKKSGGIGGIFGGGKKSSKEKEKQQEESIEDAMTQLEQRVSVVEGGLSRTGVRTARLGSEELVELYYKLFNPGESTSAAGE